MKKIFDLYKNQYISIDYPETIGNKNSEPLNMDMVDALMASMRTFIEENEINLVANGTSFKKEKKFQRSFIKRRPNRNDNNL